MGNGAIAEPGAATPEATQITVASQGAAVTAAFMLGWRLAELYDQDALPPPSLPAAGAQVPDHLPGASEMSDHDRAVVLLEQAGAALTVLSAVLGTDLPGLDTIRAALDQPGHHHDDVRQAILTAYLAIRSPLLGAAPSAATSFGLGRLLADTVWLPRSRHPELFLERFSTYRVSNACNWLDDLSAAFPHRAAAAARVSLRAWESWVSGQQKGGTASPDSFGEDALRALHRQGEMWRRLLSGEKDPLQLLGAEDYVAAGERLLQRGRQIARRFIWKWCPVIVVFLALSGGAIWAAITYAPAGTDRLAAVLVSGAATLGLSWKGVSATLGKALALWASEVNAATRASSHHPPRQQRSISLWGSRTRPPVLTWASTLPARIRW